MFFERLPTKSWQRQRSVVRAFTTGRVSRAWLFAKEEEQESRRMAYLFVIGKKISRSKADFAPAWRTREDSNL